MNEAPQIGTMLLCWWQGDLVIPPIEWKVSVLPTRWQRQMLRAIRKGRYPR